MSEPQETQPEPVLTGPHNAEQEAEQEQQQVEDAEVEIQVVPVFGAIIIYIEEDVELNIYSFIHHFSLIENESVSTTCYTDTNIVPFGYVRNKNYKIRNFIYLDETINPESYLTNIDHKNVFNWFIKIIKKSSNIGFICSTNIDKYLKNYARISTNTYLTMAASTIIYDAIGLFSGEFKQLDFPKIEHYSFYKKEGIIDGVIYIDNANPVIVEILLYFMNERYIKYGNTFNVDGHDTNIVKIYSVFDSQLEYSDVSEWILDEEKNIEIYENDTCFILGCKLFGYCVKINFEYIIGNETVNDYIIISSLIIDEQLNMRIDIKFSNQLLYGLEAIKSIYSIRHKLKETIEIKTSYSVLNFSNNNNIMTMIEGLKIPQNKKSLLEALYLHSLNLSESPMILDDTIYIINPINNQIFVGFPYLDDINIIRHLDSICTLFTYEHIR